MAMMAGESVIPANRGRGQLRLREALRHPAAGRRPHHHGPRRHRLGPVRHRQDLHDRPHRLPDRRHPVQREYALRFLQKPKFP
ncbi:hypothetical protein RHGRI_037289 [Rhododendron griersonianum]|uniref:Uncharacterized protein n=1 Tax=Rhododendron griersonianum TaxID=479676 RepID=A0AAV6HWN3_9ERIC|nr:hypothetical protein RHGRI_037289 [Rhododendron griersonianum]